MWTHTMTHVGTPTHSGHMVAATKPSQVTCRNGLMRHLA